MILAMLTERPVVATGSEGVTDLIGDGMGTILELENDPAPLAEVLAPYAAIPNFDRATDAARVDSRRPRTTRNRSPPSSRHTCERGRRTGEVVRTEGRPRRSHLSGRAGGIASYTRTLLASFDRIEPKLKLTVFTARTSRDLPYGFRQRRLWTPRRHRLERLLISVELARLRLDVLHSPDFIPPLRGARRHLITVHDLAFLRYPEFLASTAKQYYNEQIRWAVSRADHILATSESTKRDLMELLAVPAEKITVQSRGSRAPFGPFRRRTSRA